MTSLRGVLLGVAGAVWAKFDARMRKDAPDGWVHIPITRVRARLVTPAKAAARSTYGIDEQACPLGPAGCIPGVPDGGA